MRAQEAAGRPVFRWVDPEPGVPPTDRIRQAASTGAPKAAPTVAPRRAAKGTGVATTVRVAIATASCVALAVTGAIWTETGKAVSGFRVSHALGRQAPHYTGGAQNILLMGLDTRKDLNGQDLPAEILDQLHAGDSSDGGYNTNTLILAHVSSDGRQITAFSIPRDDLVDVQGVDVSQAKIKEAYGRKKAATEDELVSEGVKDPVELETRGREAGRAETLQTVETLTGVQIDRFAEVSLFGFYDLAKALGGVRVCLRHAVRDRYSGAHFPAGVQRLSARQSLAFVRQRHGLPNGDLDRTHRQQAFMLSALHQLRQQGTFTDVGKVNALIDAAQRNIVLSDGWNLPDWATEMGGSMPKITFETLPVLRYSTFDGQDVNIVDPDAIKARIQHAFNPPAGSHHARGKNRSPSSSEVTADPSETTAADQPDSGEAVTSSAGIPCVN